MENRREALNSRMVPLHVRSLAKVSGGLPYIDELPYFDRLPHFDTDVPERIVRVVTCQVCGGLNAVSAKARTIKITCSHCGFTWMINIRE